MNRKIPPFWICIPIQFFITDRQIKYISADISDLVNCGHGVLMGKKKLDWQDTDYILNLYGSKYSIARLRHQEFVNRDDDRGAGQKN